MNALNNAGVFLISTLFDLYLMVLVIRLLLAFARADFYNPVTQLIVKITQPIVNPVRRFLPNTGKVELATVFWIILLEAIKFIFIGLLLFGMPNIVGVVLLTIADICKSILNTLFYAIIISAILSWIQQSHSPVGRLLTQLTAPIMRPAQRLIPPISGFDLSPIPVLILLQVIMIVIVSPLFSIGIATLRG